MIAMQYSFGLPADYDMSIVERRIKEKGHALDDHQPLAFKAYLMARKDDPVTGSKANLYAPFYLWRCSDALRDFVCSAGFAGLVNSFGWPAVLSWPAVICSEQGGALPLARFASREIVSLPPFVDLSALQRDECESARSAVQVAHAVLALSAFEPTSWTLVRFRMWRDATSLTQADGAQAYNVLHVSHPAAPEFEL
ncbi:MAG TPA: DUF4865 family protein [Pseudomonadales bacterium]|nr:DUF4865 family protein [Pseudomonadales bacterium]